MSTTDQARHLYASERAPLSTMRYAVSVRTDSADGLEQVLAKSSRVLLSLHAPSPHGPRGFDVASVERLPRDGKPGPDVQVWDASTESAARAETRAMLRERAESYESDAQKYADLLPRAFYTVGFLTAEECERAVVIRRTIAIELRKVAASL